MEFSAAEKAVLERYHTKTRIAGGPRTGYVLRQDAILYGADDSRATELGSGLDRLVEKGLLSASEDRRFFFLTESGVTLLADWR
jgi:DNA-binding PadR family transcriptional regulator